MTRKELLALGLPEDRIVWNPHTGPLYEHILAQGRARITSTGAVVTNTVPYTGRSPNDKFLVEEPTSRDHVWWGEVNRPFPEQAFLELRKRVLAYLQAQPRIFVEEVYAGAHPRHRFRIRVVTESAWHALFARNMFIVPHTEDPEFDADYTIFHAPYFRATPELDGTRSEAFVILHLGRREILIGGTPYAGEMKKSIFTVLNYELPLRGVLSMHCSANYGRDKNDVSLFFGLSGTGKTTLSMDPDRTIVGDDEHGWGEDGVFNFEGGSYAKVIRISAEHEPLIYKASLAFGSILENVVMDDQGYVDFDDDRHTENTRAAFSLKRLENVDLSGQAGHPRQIFFLTADAFGVMPPLARLNRAQTMYYFLLGYTSKLAGTERGVKEPQPTFSACFGAPFLVHHPAKYAVMLAEFAEKHGVEVWLLNTGWTGGPYGEGHRMPLPYTRAMVHAVQQGVLRDVPFETEPYFGLSIPTRVPGVPEEVLRPWTTWKDLHGYREKVEALKSQFDAYMKKFRENLPEEVVRMMEGA